MDTEHEGELLDLTEESPAEELPALAEAGPGPRAETFSIPDFNRSVKSCGIRKRSFETNSKTVKTHVCRKIFFNTNTTTKQYESILVYIFLHMFFAEEQSEARFTIEKFIS